MANIDKNSTAKAKRRDINRQELRLKLSAVNKISHITDTIEKLEDVNTPLEQVEVSRLKAAMDARISLLKKYLPDEKSVEIKNADGETFKTDVATFVFTPVGQDD